jgi:hypothetical protein
MHICAQQWWTFFQMQACSPLHDLYTGNAHIVANFFGADDPVYRSQFGAAKTSESIAQPVFY